MCSAECNPSSIRGSSFDREHWADSSSIRTEQHRVVQNLTKPEAKLPGFVARRQALDLRDAQCRVVVPREVKVGATPRGPKRLHTLSQNPRGQSVLRSGMGPKSPVDFIRVHREWLPGLGCGRLVSRQVIREYLDGRKGWAWNQLSGRVASVACFSKEAAACWCYGMVLPIRVIILKAGAQ